VALEHKDRLLLGVVGYEDELVLDLVVGVADTLLFGKEFSKLSLIVYTVLYLTKLREFVLELLRVHLLVVIFSHDLHEFGLSAEKFDRLRIHLLN
jgi:hypothetical protein